MEEGIMKDSWMMHGEIHRKPFREDDQSRRNHF